MHIAVGTQRQVGAAMVGLAALLALVIVFPASGSAAPASEDLAQVVVSQPPPGFVEAPPGTPNTGHLTPQQFSDLAGNQDPKIAKAHFESFLRRFDNASVHQTIVVIGVRLPGTGDAKEFLAGEREAAHDNQSGIQSVFQPTLPSSIGYVQHTSQGTAVSVAFADGRDAFSFTLLSRVGSPDPDPAVVEQLALQQRSAVPAADTASDANGVVDHLAYAAGTTAVIALVAALIFVAVRRTIVARNPASNVGAGQAPPPGWYPDPNQGATLRYWDGQQWTVHSAVPGGSS